MENIELFLESASLAVKLIFIFIAVLFISLFLYEMYVYIRRKFFSKECNDLNELKVLVRERFYNGLNLRGVNTKGIVSFKGLFEDPLFDNAPDSFFEGVEDWNMLSAENIDYMFYGCKNFNRPIQKWRLHNLVTANYALALCGSFNRPLAKWDVGKLKYADGLFYGCIQLDSDVNIKSLFSLVSARYIFAGCLSLREINVKHINFDSVIDITGGFEDCVEVEGSFSSSFVNLKEAKEIYKGCKVETKFIHGGLYHLLEIRSKSLSYLF